MSQDSRIPQSIAGFNIVERIGVGSFATVYKGIAMAPSESGVRSTVAIKCIDRRQAIASKIASDCVVAEIAILKKMKHRHIVQLLDFQWDRTSVYLIMEFCGGGDLSSFIRRHESLSERITQRCFQQLASALHYMRESHIAHMDLKPQNILLTNRRRPFIKVSDFGLAQHLTAEDRAHSFRGSPLYMAPEIFTRREYDSRVDLWSCGVILYECLYGRAPFSSSSYEDLKEQIKSHESIKFPPANLSDSCADLLTRLLVRNPHNRISFDEFFSHPFVDIEHAPSDQTLSVAEQLAVDAMRAEQKGVIADHHATLSLENKVRALKLLMDALELFLPAIASCESDEERMRLRSRVDGLMGHAEGLKKDLKPAPDSPGGVVLVETPRPTSDMKAWEDTPQVAAALLVATNARELEMHEKWKEALSKYQLAVESGLRILADESQSSQRRASLHARVSRWLSRAEHIKMFLEVLEQDSRMAAKEVKEKEIESEIAELDSQSNSCVIQ